MRNRQKLTGMEFKMKMMVCVRWEGTDRGGEEDREGADYAGGDDHKIWVFKKKFFVIRSFYFR